MKRGKTTKMKVLKIVEDMIMKDKVIIDPLGVDQGRMIISKSQLTCMPH